MFRRRSMTGEVLHEERTAYDAILKTTALKARATAQELIWANAEENPYFLILFGKLAELQYIQSEAEKIMAEKFMEVNKAFKHVFQEERIVEETKKEQLNYLTKVTKLNKQLEGAKKKGDSSKINCLEQEASVQGRLYGQLSQSVEAKVKKLEVYKINLLKKGLRLQAEGVITLSTYCQQLYAAQMELLDLLPNSPPTSTGTTAEREIEDVKDMMSAVVNKVSETLNIVPPSFGGVDLRKTGSESPLSSPGCNRRSFIEPFGFLNGKKDFEFSRMDKRKRFSSCSTDNVSSNKPIAGETHHPPSPNNDIFGPPDYSPPPNPNVYCEIMIPGLHTKDKPTLAKSKSDSSVSQLSFSGNEDPEMTTRFEQRLEQAGLMKQSVANISQSSTPFSSTEDVASDDTGYAKLRVVSAGPRQNVNAKKFSEGGDSSGDYANPADALKLNPHHVQFQLTTPPSSPRIVNTPPLSNQTNDSPYQSVDEVRKMREKQIKEKDKKPPKTVISSTNDSNQPLTVNSFQDDDSSGYSMPFDALKKFHMASEGSSKAPQTWHRTNSNDKIMINEPSARFLHQVGPSSFSGKLPSEKDQKPDLPPRCASTSSKLMLSSTRFGGVSPHTTDTSLLSPTGSESGNQVPLNEASTQVNRYILKVESKESEESEMRGRTQSIDSALYTPAKVTKLRSGHAMISNKTCVSILPPQKTGKK